MSFMNLSIKMILILNQNQASRVSLYLSIKIKIKSLIKINQRTKPHSQYCYFLAICVTCGGTGRTHLVCKPSRQVGQKPS